MAFILPNLTEHELIKEIYHRRKHKNMAQIKGPFALKINEPAISDDLFYRRISEQLRHKNRVVSNWDAEQIILNKFTQIEKVRTYGRSSHPDELVKGSSLQIVLIPKNKTGRRKPDSEHKS